MIANDDDTVNIRILIYHQIWILMLFKLTLIFWRIRIPVYETILELFRFRNVFCNSVLSQLIMTYGLKFNFNMCVFLLIWFWRKDKKKCHQSLFFSLKKKKIPLNIFRYFVTKRIFIKNNVKKMMSKCSWTLNCLFYETFIIKYDRHLGLVPNATLCCLY